MFRGILTVTIAIALLPSAGGRSVSSLRAQRTVEASGQKQKAAAHTAASSQISATATISSATKSGLSMKAHQVPLMDDISAMRAEMCAHQKVGVSAEYEDCLEFMVTACNPGPDMLMNGTPGEISTGKGYCTEFFTNYQAGEGALEAASPAAAPGAPAPPGMPLGLGHNLGDVHAENQIDFPSEEERQVEITQNMESTMEEVAELMKVRSESVDEKKEELAALYWYEEELQAKLKDLDEDVYCLRVKEEAVLVANETTAPELSEMLAAMRCEMQRFSLPFYRKVVESNIAMVQEQQKTLMQQIEQEKKQNRTKTLEEEEEEMEETAKVEEKKVEEKAEEGTDYFSWLTGMTYSWDLLLIAVVIAVSVCVCFFGKVQRSD